MRGSKNLMMSNAGMEAGVQHGQIAKRTFDGMPI